MNTPGIIEQKVEETLSSLDHTQRATANPFLYTRIMASLTPEEKNLWSRALQILSRPVIAITAILFVIIVNSLVLLQSTDTSQATVQEDDQLFATEYNYPPSTADRFYTVNEEQP